MGKIYIFAFSVFLYSFVCGLAYPQELPVKEITQIVVESNRKFFSDDHTSRLYTIKPGSSEQHENIGHFLERKSPAIIRNYGARGSLVSVSLHGTGSNHTQLTWNGIPLNSPTTGQADLSLIPAGFVQTIEIINGASGSLFGSGTFGGSINLNNAPEWDKRFSIAYSFDAGSYGQMDHMINLKTGNKRIQYQLFAASASAINNFRYRDHYFYNSPMAENKHNAYKSLGILQNVYLNLNRGQYIEAGIWYQSKSLEIPALMGSYGKSFAHQKDSVFRSFISYRKTGYKYALVIRSAYFSDFINYTDKVHADSGYSLNSKIATSRLMNEADYRYFLSSKLIAGGGVAYNLTTGNSGNFGGRIQENEYSVYGSLKMVLRKLIINGGLRKEFYKGLNPDPQYSAGVRYKISKGITIRSSFSTRFRKPTFNEKYWKPGGNKDLRPEKGRGGELTFEWQTDRVQSNIWLESRLTGFFQSVDNWIQWIIKDSLTPVEYKKVHAKGLEAWLGFGMNRTDFKVEGHMNYNFNRSSIVRTFDNNALYQGNQLIYIPKHTFRASTDVTYKSFMSGFYATYTGMRETVETADFYLQLPAYTTVDVYLGFRHNILNFPLILNFRVDNVFDKSFEVIRSFPVPGRTFHFTFTLALKHIPSTNQ